MRGFGSVAMQEFQGAMVAAMDRWLQERDPDRKVEHARVVEEALDLALTKLEFSCPACSGFVGWRLAVFRSWKPELCNDGQNTRLKKLLQSHLVSIGEPGNEFVPGNQYDCVEYLRACRRAWPMLAAAAARKDKISLVCVECSGERLAAEQGEILWKINTREIAPEGLPDEEPFRTPPRVPGNKRWFKCWERQTAPPDVLPVLQQLDQEEGEDGDEEGDLLVDRHC